MVQHKTSDQYLTTRKVSTRSINMSKLKSRAEKNKGSCGHYFLFHRLKSTASKIRNLMVISYEIYIMSHIIYTGTVYTQ